MCSLDCRLLQPVLLLSDTLGLPLKGIDDDASAVFSQLLFAYGAIYFFFHICAEFCWCRHRSCAHISTFACSNIGVFVDCTESSCLMFQHQRKESLHLQFMLLFLGFYDFKCRFCLSQAITHHMERANVSVWCQAKLVWLRSIESAESYKLCQHPVGLLPFNPENPGGQRKQIAAATFWSNQSCICLVYHISSPSRVRLNYAFKINVSSLESLTK